MKRYTNKEMTIAGGTALTLVSIVSIYNPSFNLLTALIGVLIVVIASVKIKD